MLFFVSFIGFNLFFFEKIEFLKNGHERIRAVAMTGHFVLISFKTVVKVSLISKFSKTPHFDI